MEKKINSLREFPKEGELFGINLQLIKMFNIYRGFDKEGAYNRNIGLMDSDLEDGLTICEYIGNGICVECLTGTKIQLTLEMDQYVSEKSYRNSRFQMNQECTEMMQEYEKIKEAPLSYPIGLRNGNKPAFSNLYKIDDSFKFSFGKQKNKESEIQSAISECASRSLEIMKICFEEISKDEHSIAYTDNVIFNYKRKSK